jgi:hypothetical protein
MKEYVLTQPYNSLEEMLNSAEMSIYKEELMQGNIEKYAIVSRIGNRYDLNGNKIEDFVDNPFFVKQEDIPVSYCEITSEDIIEEAGITIKEFIGGKTMKYTEIEEMIDDEIQSAVENALADAEVKHEQEIEQLKKLHEDELATVKANAKAEAKAELIAKLNN